MGMSLTTYLVYGLQVDTDKLYEEAEDNWDREAFEDEIWDHPVLDSVSVGHYDWDDAPLVVYLRKAKLENAYDGGPSPLPALPSIEDTFAVEDLHAIEWLKERGIEGDWKWFIVATYG